MSKTKPALFLDRDGVICAARRDYVKSVEEFEMLEGVAGGIRRARDAGYTIVVATNQAGVGRGLYSLEGLSEIHDHMRKLLSIEGAEIDAVYYCPHTAADGCACRKPLPGMLAQAAGELGLDLSSSYLVGDSLRDLLAAAAAGVTPVLVLTGYGEEELMKAQETSGLDYLVARDLAAVAANVLHR